MTEPRCEHTGNRAALGRREFLRLGAAGAALAACAPILAAEGGAPRPNVLWITAEDHGPHLGCYGDTYADTPNLDALAARAMRYTHAWSTVPVCAPARTAIISGMYPSSLGAEHMRSMVPLPAGTRMYPQFLREAGYYCTNNSKEDYNLRKPQGVWDASSGQAHWRNRAPGQPFFAIFNFAGTHESQIWNKARGLKHDPAKARVPAYHPDTPETRADWARYYDNVTASDTRAGELLRELQEAGLAEDTIVFYYADHGAGMPRGKRTACNSGLQMPLIVYFPGKWRHLAPKEYQPGGASERLVGFVDLAPTLLSLIGVAPPAWMQGSTFAGPHQTPPPAVMHGLRGRMDSRCDLVRAATDGRYVYVRNFLPHLPHGQRVHFQFRNDTTQAWHRLYTEGKANEAQSQFWKAPRAPEELYDLAEDPDEVRNLAASPEHREPLERLRRAMRKQAARVRDVGFLPEAEVNRRAAGASPYDMARTPGKYDFERIFAAADAASSLAPLVVAGFSRLKPATTNLAEPLVVAGFSRLKPATTNLAALRAGLADRDSGVRYWSVLGLQMRGAEAVRGSADALRRLLGDECPSVRIAAAEALATFGEGDAVKAAAGTLADALQRGGDDVPTVLAVLNALDRLGARMGPYHEVARAVAAIPARNPKWEGRSGGNIGNLKPDVLAELENSSRK